MPNNVSEAEKPHEPLAQALGWFSIGLGLTQILAPHQLARAMGVRPRPVLFRVLGLREITSGVGILTNRKPANWLWTRVAGDAMDLALIGAAFTRSSNQRNRLATTAAAVAGVSALDYYCSQQMSREVYSRGHGDAIHVTKAVVINRSPEELYAFWRQFDRLPTIMNHLKSVKVIDERRSHWVARAPAGKSVEWDAEIINDVPGALIAWRSLPGADVDNAGSVRFDPLPGNRGTVVKVELQYRPPGGPLGALIAKLFGEAPEQQLNVDLRRFKQLIETGEIARTEGQPAGRPSSTSKKYDDFVRY